MSGFSEREVQLMACAFQAMKTPPEIDYQVMARLAGMSHPGSASNAMRAIRRKLDARVPGTGNAVVSGNGSPGTPAKKTSRAGKKRSAANMTSTSDSFFDNEEEDAAATDESPSKKKNKIKSRAKGGEDDAGAVKVKKERRDEEDEVEEHGEDEDIDVEEV
ncbi:hypothetical protein DIS24_g4952 [Lasiodiplodia hormozganensis]|uniref:Uncharacterized protein n=1 Tax=Lasiodiplodia hormozganensis TaxID=869390 RepID=A0AA40D0E7_9PEZI|nr:hypothetical protein DIS24_g4952 [Lasiodiplodia hormozganensis]